MVLEKETMALYTRYAKVFEAEPKFREFWFSMARDEANHVGALTLVSTVLECEGLLEQPSPFAMEDEMVRRLRTLLERARLNAAGGLDDGTGAGRGAGSRRVGDRRPRRRTLKGDQAEREYERYQRLLVHDLGDLSYMIERYCQDQSLLSRCDALVERHAAALRQSSAGAKEEP